MLLQAWSSPGFFGEGFPFCVDLELSFNLSSAMNVAAQGSSCHPVDVYNATWQAYAQQQAAKIIRGNGLQDNMWLVGYFTDNEIGWCVSVLRLRLWLIPFS